MSNVEFEEGTKRIRCSNLKHCVKSNDAWEDLDYISDDVKSIIDLYRRTLKFDELKSVHEDSFLKGVLNPEGKITGERIKVLPDGKVLARGGFSLFAKGLKFNRDDESHLWDVCYENDSGLKTYLYSEDKVHLEQDKKLKLVEKFSQNYDKILTNSYNGLRETDDSRYLALYTLLKTLIRVGNLEYYKRFEHKGLTTLQKKDITVDGNYVTFDFIGKDGVPHSITKEFDLVYINRLLERLNSLDDDDDFVFSNVNKNPLHSSDFSKLMFDWTGEHFYPHIVRSHYADSCCADFLKHHRKASKELVESEFLKIASNLGHKKFNKKTENWEPNFTVTLANYIYPDYSERMKKLYE